MDALTIWQPWASLVMAGWKPHEFRKWDFSAPRKIGPRLVRGRDDLVGKRIVICAGARAIVLQEMHDLTEAISCGESSVDVKAIPLLQRIRDAHKCRGVVPMACGLGTVLLGQPKRTSVLYAGTRFMDSDRFEHQLFGWPVSEPKIFPDPIPVRGMQSFFTFPAVVPEGF